MLSAGTSHGVQPGQAVASRHFTVDRGEGDGAREGMAILLGETLVGWIEQVGSHNSRVKLLCDVSVQRKVRIGRHTADRGVVLIDGYHWLKGKGRGRMEIEGVDRRLVDPQRPLIQVGDVVVSDPNAEELPTAMAIGSVDSIVLDRDNPLLATLGVVSGVDEHALDRVYVYDPTAP